jgi:hypothetical protein
MVRSRKYMRKAIFAALSMALTIALASPALAGSLPAGRPASVRRAQMEISTGLVLLGSAAIIALVVAVSASGNDHPAVTSTSVSGTAS